MEADVLTSTGKGSDIGNVSAVKTSPSSIILSRKLFDFSFFIPASTSFKTPINYMGLEARWRLMCWRLVEPEVTSETCRLCGPRRVLSF